MSPNGHSAKLDRSFHIRALSNPKAKGRGARSRVRPSWPNRDDRYCWTQPLAAFDHSSWSCQEPLVKVTQL